MRLIQAVWNSETVLLPSNSTGWRSLFYRRSRDHPHPRSKFFQRQKEAVERDPGWLARLYGDVMTNFFRPIVCQFLLSMRLRNRVLRAEDLLWKQTWLSNDKTIIWLGYRKISWFVCVSKINYLPQPFASRNNWSSHHWQITKFCSTSSNNC